MLCSFGKVSLNAGENDQNVPGAGVMVLQSEASKRVAAVRGGAILGDQAGQGLEGGRLRSSAVTLVWQVPLWFFSWGWQPFRS